MSRDVARAVLVVTQRTVPVSVVARNHSGRSRRLSASRAEGIPSFSLGRMRFGSDARKAISPPEKIPSRAMQSGMSIRIQRSLMALPFPQHHPDIEDPCPLDLADHEAQSLVGNRVTPRGQPSEEMEDKPADGAEILRGNGCPGDAVKLIDGHGPGDHQVLLVDPVEGPLAGVPFVIDIS